jgi:hypothetical protein
MIALRLRIRIVSLIALLGVPLAACERDDGGGGAPQPTADDTDVPVTLTPVEPPVAGTPLLALVETMHDFGTVNAGLIKTHRFEFRNLGPGRLVIQSITPACRCTTVSLDRFEYEPDERGFIEVAYDTAGRGTQSWRMTILANTDPPTSDFYVQADVRPFAWPNPAQVDFDTVERGTEHVVDLTLSTPDPETRMTAMESSNPNVRIEPVPADEQPRRRTTWATKLRVTLAPETEWGVLSGTITARFEGRAMDESEPREQEVEVAVRGAVVGRLIALPMEIAFGAIAAGTTQRTILLTAPIDEPFEIQAVRTEVTTPIGSTIRHRPYSDPNRVGYQLFLSVDPRAHLGHFDGTIIVETDVPGEETLRIPFAGAAARTRP